MCHVGTYSNLRLEVLCPLAAKKKSPNLGSQSLTAGTTPPTNRLAVSHPILATLGHFGQPRPKKEGFAGGREASILTYGRILTWDFQLGAAHEQGY